MMVCLFGLKLLIGAADNAPFQGIGARLCGELSQAEWLTLSPRVRFIIRLVGGVVTMIVGLIVIDDGLEHGLLDLHDPVISNYFLFFGGMFFLIMAIIATCVLVFAHYHNWNLDET